jgi:predicted DNA-binding WGR domain protein
MRQSVGPIVRVLAAMCLLACSAGSAVAQDEGDFDLSARQRVFPGVGPGLRTIKRGADGRLYILASPSPGLLVFDAQGKQVLSVNELGVASSGTGQGHALITFGEDCDGAADGKIYVADRGANLIQVFTSDGAPLRSIRMNAPVAVAALPEGEVAVATLREPHLVIVFDKNGKDVREFGDPEPLSEREDYNRYLSIGQLATDAQGHLYYAFSYLPEPTVRQYDRLGYAGQDFQYTAVEAFATAQAARKEIERQESKGKEPSFKRVLTAVGVDRTNGEVWIALNNRLLHFDKEGNRRATYKIYTPQGARLEANTILVEPDRLIIGSDPLGIYEFERPDKKNTK